MCLYNQNVELSWMCFQSSTEFNPIRLHTLSNLVLYHWTVRWKLHTVRLVVIFDMNRLANLLETENPSPHALPDGSSLLQQDSWFKKHIKEAEAVILSGSLQTLSYKKPWSRPKMLQSLCLWAGLGTPWCPKRRWSGRGRSSCPRNPITPNCWWLLRCARHRVRLASRLRC